MSRIAGCLAAMTAAALFVFPTTAAEPKLPSLDSALSTAAPTILKELRTRQYKNVGVLKFLVAEGDGKPRGNVGSLNRTLADRLEVALALTNDDPQFGIVAHASDVVATVPSANHLDPEGRTRLFKIPATKFSVPWKPNTPIKPDAFLTGIATISPDRRTIKVRVLVCDRDNVEKKELDTLAEFTAANDTRNLTEIGVTYVPRGGAAPTEDQLAQVDLTAPAPDDKLNELQKKAEKQLAVLENSPVQLEILYDGQAQTPKADFADNYQTNALLSVLPPAETTKKVQFRLTNRSKDNLTYGVVLRVNGFNTIFKEQQDPLLCHKWILKPGDSVTIQGFQIDEKEMAPFKVAAPTRSQLNALSYDEQLGTIDLIVFRGLPKPPTATVDVDPKVKAEAERVALIGRGAMLLRNEPPATDLKAFQTQLKHEGTDNIAAGRTGGLIGSAPDGEKNLVKKVEFFPNRIPESTTIRYYKLEK